jgi:hypothetical protein
MQLVDPTCLTLFPPAKWSGRTAVVEITTLVMNSTTLQLKDDDCDEIERDLRGIVARRLRGPACPAAGL